MFFVTSFVTFLHIALVLSSNLVFLRAQQLYIRYPGGDWIIPGSTLDITESTRTPELGGKDLTCDLRYLLLFIDLDGQIPGTAISTVVLHWYRPDLLLNCSNSTPAILYPDEDASSEYIADYVAPQAPPCSHHRYAYLLFAQPASYKFPQCFAHIPPKTLDGRAGFDVYEFISAAVLDPPIAMNYFFGRNNASGGAQPIPSPTTTSFRSMTCKNGPTGVGF